MYSKKFVETFGEARRPQEDLEPRHYDMAATLQKFLEETLIAIVRYVNKETKKDCLCLAGGVFLNCVANHKLLEETSFKEVFIQPSAGDSGGALGAASYVYHCLLNNPRNYVLKDVFLGPAFSKEQIKEDLLSHGLVYKELDDSVLFNYVAQKIAGDQIVGWVQGRMEFGPRALGARSILANPCNPNMKDLINAKVKKREPFRPYAPMVLEENAKEYFQLKNLSPFMLLAPLVQQDKKLLIPSAVHVDGTARVQTVNKETNPRCWQLIKAFESITGVPIILNTSFNLRGEPIVCSPRDAIQCFQRSQMDCLVIENFVVEKAH
jgi:carbamoyltransferase